ncbi:MAG: alpha/beta fold hydrolase [Dermatophilaceae bacterium]
MHESPEWNPASVDVPGPDGPMPLDVWTTGDADAAHPVLALHGFPQSARSWRAVGDGLAAKGVRVIAPDQRGYSPQARPEGVEHYRMGRLVDDALSVADGMGAERFHLLGHDWGAQVGWNVCDRAPERVLSYTALSVPHPRAFATAYKQDEEQRTASEYISLFWQPGVAEEWLAGDDWAGLRRMLTGLPAEEVEHYVMRMREPGALTAALGWYRAMESGADAPPTRVPTTYVWSTDDAALRRSGAELCGDFVEADYRFVVLEGVSHWIPDEAPDAVVEAVLDRIGTD